jgi:hypothetical protein
MSYYERIMEFIENKSIDLFEYFENRRKNIESFFDELKKTPDMQNSILKYGIFIGIIISIIFIFYYSSIDPKSMTTNKYLYLLLITIPLIIGIFYVIPFKNGNILYNVFIIFLLLGFVVTILYYYSNSNLASSTFISYIMFFLIFLIIICGLAIFLYVFTNYLKSLKGTSGFLVYLLFYLPCLLIDFIKYIINEFKLTANEIYILFFIELSLILIYIYLPLLLSKIVQKNGIVLMGNSAFLDIPKVIGNNEQFLMQETKTDKINTNLKSYRREFSLSMWIYLNSQPSNYSAYSKETPIFDFGNGKPKITYYNNTSNNNSNNIDIRNNTVDDGKDKIIVYFTNTSDGSIDESDRYKFVISKQKWHQIVFNYSSEYVDLFIDGNLEKTYDFNENLPTFYPTDNITIGSTNGLDGSICNIVYYTKIQSKSQIANSYNILFNKNPPVQN